MITISHSLIDGNKWFIYRNHGVEIDFKVVNNEIDDDTSLTPEENYFIQKNILKRMKKSEQYFSSMNKRKYKKRVKNG